MFAFESLEDVRNQRNTTFYCWVGSTYLPTCSHSPKSPSSRANCTNESHCTASPPGTADLCRLGHVLHTSQEPPGQVQRSPLSSYLEPGSVPGLSQTQNPLCSPQVLLSHPNLRYKPPWLNCPALQASLNTTRVSALLRAYCFAWKLCDKTKNWAI